MAADEVPVQIFISYARDDDEAPSGLPGFVTNLHDELRREFKSLGAPRPKIWRDKKEIARADQFRPEIENAIKASSILVVVLSRNWLQSTWCKRELDAFERRWRAAGDDGIKKRIVVVGKHFVDYDKWPRLLEGQEGFDFFAFDGEKEEGEETQFFHRGKIHDGDSYDARIKELGNELWKKARRLTAAPAASSALSSQNGNGAEPAGRIVYLAKPTFDMRDDYACLVEELQGRGFVVVPSPKDAIVLDGAEVESIDNALSRSEVSIHLLGKPRSVVEKAIVELQLARAAAQARERESGKGGFRRIVWAPKVWQSEGARNPSDVLASFDAPIPTDSIHGDGRPKFVDSLIQHLDRNAPRQTNASEVKEGARVYLDHCLADSAYVFDLCKALRQRQVKPVLAVLPGQGDDPAEVRAQHLRYLVECDVVVLCWAAGSEMWARSKMHELKNWRDLGRNERFACRGLVTGPPPGLRKDVIVANLDDEEIDLVVNLASFDQPPPEKLEELVQRVRPDR